MHKDKKQRAALLLATALVGMTAGGCSISGAVDKLVSAEDKAFALGVAKAACDGTLERYQRQIAPQLTEEYRKNSEKLKPFCPTGPGEAKLVGFQFNTQMVNGATAKTQQLVVMTQSPGRWSRTVMQRASSNGGPLLLHNLTMNATPEKPADLVQADQWDAMVPYLRIALVVALLLLVAGVWWLIRRHDSKRNADG